MGLALILIGVVVWLATRYDWLGLLLVVIGLILLFVPWPGAYGYSYYRGRRPPP